MTTENPYGLTDDPGSDDTFDPTASSFRDLAGWTPGSAPPDPTYSYAPVAAPISVPTYSNGSTATLVAPAKPALPDVQIILDNVLLMRVMRHIHGYNGTICTNPTRVQCGAQDYFRQNYCERKDPRCFDYSLYGDEQYIVRKPRNEEYEEFLSQVVPGNLMLYWTNRDKFNYLVGVYVVDKIEARDGREGLGIINQPYYRIEGNRDLSVRFNESLIDSSFVWNRSVRSEYYSKFIRKLERSAVVPSLRTIQEKHEAKAAELRTAARLPEAEQCMNVVRRLDNIIKLAVDQAAPTTATTSYPLYSSPAAAITSPTVPTTVSPSLISRRATPTASGKTAGTEVARVMDYLRQEKLYYPEDLVWRYHISLMSKPFVILTGVSGGGKTQLTRVYAEAINNSKTNNNYCLVSVRPDWNSNESLLGNYDILNRRFVPTLFCEFIKRAENDWRARRNNAKKYFVCLDEMNLARAEYYFSDFLSRMEVDGEDLRRIRLYDAPSSGGGDDEIGQDLYIPPNLYITGTVNLDETTHTFSRKVLDRANIIKVDRIDIAHMLELLRADYPSEVLDFVGVHLREINFRLAEAGQQFGYRTVREILEWVQQASDSGYFTLAQALDIQIVQKVLVKIEVSGDHVRQTAMLDKLISYFEQEARQDDVPIFERSAETINALVARLTEDDVAIGQV